MSNSPSENRIEPSRRAAYGGIIIALAIALGYALAAIPNVELVTFTLAFGGVILGFGWGALVGGMGFGLYSILSPYGMAPLPLLIAQIIGGGIIGLGGAMLGRWLRAGSSPFGAFLLSALTGTILTLSYDILTNIGSFILIASSETLAAFIVGGLGFSIVHIVANGLIFALLMPMVMRLTKKYRVI